MKEQRVSLLSLRQVWEKPGIFIFLAQVIVFYIIVGHHEIGKGNGFAETLIAIFGHVALFIPVAIFHTMVFTEVGGWLMIKYQMFMDERAQRIASAEAKGKAEGIAQGIAQGKAEGIAQGKAAGIAEGKAEGIAEGKAEGIAERDREWTDWNNRRLDAAAKGQPFDEPPPLNTPPAPPQ